MLILIVAALFLWYFFFLNADTTEVGTGVYRSTTGATGTGSTIYTGPQTNVTDKDKQRWENLTPEQQKHMQEVLDKKVEEAQKSKEDRDTQLLTSGSSTTSFVQDVAEWVSTKGGINPVGNNAAYAVLEGNLDLEKTTSVFENTKSGFAIRTAEHKALSVATAAALVTRLAEILVQSSTDRRQYSAVSVLDPGKGDDRGKIVAISPVVPETKAVDAFWFSKYMGFTEVSVETNLIVHYENEAKVLMKEKKVKGKFSEKQLGAGLCAMASTISSLGVGGVTGYSVAGAYTAAGWTAGTIATGGLGAVGFFALAGLSYYCSTIVDSEMQQAVKTEEQQAKQKTDSDFDWA
jgi:hypothetical protein